MWTARKPNLRPTILPLFSNLTRGLYDNAQNVPRIKNEEYSKYIFNTNPLAFFVKLKKRLWQDSILGPLDRIQLKWESLKKRRKDNRLILLYKGLKGKASVPTDDLIPKTRRCRNQHSMAFQTPIANTDVYKGSFFPQTIRDWNALPDSLISSAEDAEDCVAKFTSLVRARY